MRRYRLGSHAKYDLKVHLVCVPNWARGYFAVTSGTITDELINEYINEQEGEPVHEDDGRFQIDPT